MVTLPELKKKGVFGTNVFKKKSFAVWSAFNQDLVVSTFKNKTTKNQNMLEEN